ncbi:hypothetical protein HWB90_gp048 [Mycobacterium phage Fowlmouth]|uniref:Uncharacterized protein n=2 Tax=Fowlmouthvirus fowlmouth TaxID=2845652 RepID=A0A7G8LPT9_9CAUD|nr:hypothetical protein HWB90_gp048 [Mycobacterium phage Fowlmouth]AYN57998.1 hypothetical protein SEA_FOWLMOUTH_48 [Mycobacterium phage Fowlmouth]QNJ59261.1 hypothetical protein SEA_MRMIYAGI_47 [Mycobacterium phage MrMiyagi]
MFTLEIRTTGDAFVGFTEQEVAKLLRDVAHQVESYAASNKTHSIIDINGNRCGSWKLTNDE